jgi:hypothetical protein
MSERDAVFKTPDQVFDFSSADLGCSEFKRCLVSEGTVRRGEPGTHFLEIAFEQLECESDEAREADESVGLFGLEPFGVLAPGQGPRRDLKNLGRTGGGEIENPTESLERFVGEPLADSRMKLSSLVSPETEQGHIRVGAMGISIDLAPEPINGLGAWVLSNGHGSLLVCHMANYTMPCGGAQGGPIHNEALHLTARCARRG